MRSAARSARRSHTPSAGLPGSGAEAEPVPARPRSGVNTFDIVDCDGTTDGTAVVQQDAGQSVDIFVRVVGPQNSSLKLFCQDNPILDINGVNSCFIGTFNLSKGKTFMKVTQHLFDTVFTQVLWTLDPTTNFRIAQVRVYRHLS